MKQNESATLSARTHPAGLEKLGIHNANEIYWNLGAAQLVEHAIQRREGSLAAGGSRVFRPAQFTGRSPKDKFIVRDRITDTAVQWGAVNQSMSGEQFERLYSRVSKFWQ